MAEDIDQLCINTIRTLSIDAIQKANSGHPGTPMAMAPVAYTLWQRFLRFDPADPIWPGRDRFVLSAGHASMLLYALLFLADVRAVDPDYEVVGKSAVGLEDIESFRQLDSRAPGHPEYRWTSGVEATTGPLGQGVATSVGMAIASKWQAARYGADLFDFDVYAIAGDGCLMEGVSGEAASLAGHLKLDNLCWVYDNNRITIDGRTELAYGDDVPARFEGYGWNIVRVEDANDLGRIEGAFDEFGTEELRPTLIVVDSHIGWGSPHKQDTAAAHGEPLGEEEVRETKRAYEWPEDAQFLVPEGVKEHFAEGVGGSRRPGARRLGGEARRVRRGEPRARRRDRGDAEARAAAGLGRGDPLLRRRPEGARHPQGLEQGPERDRRAAPLAAGRLCRPHRLDLGSLRLRRRRRLRARLLRRPPAPLRDPRARVGGDLQRPLALQAAAAVVHLPDLLRLRPPGDPALGADGAAGDPPLHARLDRPRRGRPDPPAGRAARRPAGDPRPRRDPARRRQRGGRGLAGGTRPQPPAGRPRPHAPGRAGARPLALRLGRGAAARRLRARRCEGGRSRRDPDRDRQRGGAGAGRARGAERRRDLARGSSAFPAGSCSTARTRPTATRCCRRR